MGDLRPICGPIPLASGPRVRLPRGMEPERVCKDSKGGELCLSRAKPEETLVEARVKNRYLGVMSEPGTAAEWISRERLA